MTITADLIVQLGQEATDAWGTPVASTVALAGINDVTITPMVDVQQVVEMCGTMVPSRKSLVHMVGGEASLGGLASYEHLGYWLQGLFGRATATSDVAAGYTHAYNAPFESSDVEDVITYTLVESDGTNIYNLQGATANSLTISGESGAPVEFSIDFIGKQVGTDTQDALTCATVNYIMGDHVQLFMDAGSDSFGTTATSDIGWSFEFTYNANRAVKRHLNDLTPTGYRNAKPEGTLRLSLEHDTVVEGNIQEIVSATTEGVDKNIRIYAKDASSNSLTIDFAGVLNGEPAIFQDVDGVISADLELMGQLNAGDTNWLTITLGNNVAAY